MLSSYANVHAFLLYFWFWILRLFLLDQIVSVNDKDPFSGICVTWSDRQLDRQDLFSANLSVLSMKKGRALISAIKSQTNFYLSRLGRPFQRECNCAQVFWFLILLKKKKKSYNPAKNCSILFQLTRLREL